MPEVLGRVQTGVVAFPHFLDYVGAIAVQVSQLVRVLLKVVELTIRLRRVMNVLPPGRADTALVDGFSEDQVTESVLAGEYGREIASLHAVGCVDPGESGQGGEEVDRFDEGFPVAAFLTGNADQTRDVELAVEQEGRLGRDAVIAQEFPVVRQEHDDRVVGKTLFLQTVQQQPNLPVDLRNHPVVGGFHVAEGCVGGVRKPLELVVFRLEVEPVLRRLSRDVIRVAVEGGKRVGVVHSGEASGRDIRVVRTVEADPQEEGVVRGDGFQVFERFHADVCVDVTVFGEVRGYGAELLAESGQGVAGHVLVSAIANILLEFVRIGDGVVAVFAFLPAPSDTGGRGVVDVLPESLLSDVMLADDRRPVAVRLQVLDKRDFVLAQPGPVPFDAVAARVASGHEGCTGGGADGVLDEEAVQSNAFGGEPVDGRGLDDGVARVPQRVVSQVVGRDEEDVGRTQMRSLCLDVWPSTVTGTMARSICSTGEDRHDTLPSCLNQCRSGCKAGRSLSGHQVRARFMYDTSCGYHVRIHTAMNPRCNDWDS